MHHRHPFRPTCSRFTSPWSLPGADLTTRLPIAGVDRFDDPSVALALVRALASSPPVHETLAILLDDDHRGSTIMNFDRTVDNDSVLRVADEIGERALGVGGVAGVIVASLRPGGSDELDDIERWLTIDEQFGLIGIELVEWFVVGRSISCPRALFGDASRWAA